MDNLEVKGYVIDDLREASDLHAVTRSSVVSARR
jgi:hypothetical protein